MTGRTIAIILFLLFPLAARCEITVRIFSRLSPVTVVFTAEKGDYILKDGITPDNKILPGETVAVTLYDNCIIYMTYSGRSGVADSLMFVPLEDDALFRLRAPASGEPVRRLDGTLKIRTFPGSLQILNITTVENYLPGVVRAEAGSSGSPDYFRAQAVVARTYVYRNWNRHVLDGYNLCDDTHCQVYPGIISEKKIIDACRSTAGQVLIDSDSVLIVAAFHGNCGGMTVSSADVWLAGYPYLVSITDPWCSYSGSSKWKSSIALTEWNDFLRMKGIIPGEEKTFYSLPGTETERIVKRTASGKTITSEEIRIHFGLRSAYFTMYPVGDSILISGRGYGHGVGMCQDGAKAMAERKIPYYRITGFYYPGTSITDIKYARKPVKP